MVKYCLATALVSAVFLASTVQASDEQAKAVESAVVKVYSQLSAGEFEKALGHFKIGGSGYVANRNDLVDIANEDVRNGLVAALQNLRDGGTRMSFSPTGIKVAVHGDTAVATYVLEIKTNDVPATNRGSMVWQATDNGWKVIHWHTSKATAEE